MVHYSCIEMEIFSLRSGLSYAFRSDSKTNDNLLSQREQISVSAQVPGKER